MLTNNGRKYLISKVLSLKSQVLNLKSKKNVSLPLGKFKT